MIPRVKVCCIASVSEAEMAVRAGASALGLVSAMPSGPGPIADDLITEIAHWAPPGVATFLLTSRSDPDAVVDQVCMTGVNTVQLVDAVPISTYRALRRDAPGVKIVQVIHVTGPEAVEQAQGVLSRVDALLLDSGNPHGPVRELGGTGRIHNWDISAQIVCSVGKPVYLAGGLNPDNVAEAIARVQPFSVDLCAGIRTDGALDQVKLEAFMRAVHG